MRRGQFSALSCSVLIHAGLLLGLWFLKVTVTSQPFLSALETVFLEDEDRNSAEVTQELDEVNEVAQSFSFTPGATAAAAGTAPAPKVDKRHIENQQILREPNVRFPLDARDLPAVEELGIDLGESEIAGEVGARVDGYGQAFDRLTQELARLMRLSPVLVVWLFDESQSMRDDQQEIQQRMFRVYEELKLAGVETKGRKKEQKTLLSVVTSFGRDFHQHMQRPTGDPQDVLRAIDGIPVDPTGDENVCGAIMEAIERFSKLTRRGRKLVLVVASDESGDDGHRLEPAVTAVKNARCNVYVMGRESVFGTTHAYVNWVQPETGGHHYLPIRRGPESPIIELLQHDGFGRRRDAHMSGFGSFEQVRLARESGGIFFQLPHEQENLNQYDAAEYDYHALREYLPSLDSRRDYVAARDVRDFRRAQFEVIALLNPYDETKSFLEIPRGGRFSRNPSDFRPKVQRRIQQIVNLLGVLTKAQAHLEAVSPMRVREPSQRWRANHDLMVAQLFAYRVRLFEYAIGLDRFAKSVPTRTFKNPNANAWAVAHGAKQLIMPDAEQTRALKITAEDVTNAYESAQAKLADVESRHPNTPWAKRAAWEHRRRFGVSFRELQIVPRPPRPAGSPPPPRPTPPPKL